MPSTPLPTPPTTARGRSQGTALPRIPQPPARHRSSSHAAKRPELAAAPPRPQRSYHVDSSAPHLGSGAFGAVYEGFEKTTKEPVAVKVIRKAKLSEEDAKATVYETATMRKISPHPNVLQLLDSSEDDKHMYVVTPLVSGGDLSQALKKGHSFSEDDVRDVLRNLLSGIAHMHDHGVMHRDIKPANVLLHGAVPESTSPLTPQRPSASTPVLSDFGFATDAPRSNEFCGTPYYVAPEVIAAASDRTKSTTYDAKCDVWSFGVLAFVLLNDGAKPFVGKTIRGICNLILHGQPAFTDACSSEARDFVESLLIREPTKRPTAAQALQHPWLCPRDPFPFSPFECDSLAASSAPLTEIDPLGSPIATEGMSVSTRSLLDSPAPAACAVPLSAVRLPALLSAE